MARYAFSDIHSRYDLLKQILDYAEPTDVLYFLGDAADRGSDPWKCISALMSDKRIIWIKGNHDEFLLRLPSIYEAGTFFAGGWISNGGINTIDECLLNLRTEENINSFCNFIKKLPERIDIVNAEGKNIILTHAGLDPTISDSDYRAWYGQRESRYLWDRTHIHAPWRGDSNTYIIHGHTPVPYIDDMNPEEEEEFLKNPKIKIYAGGHKIDLDIGAVWSNTAAVWSNTAALFNLDTFEVKYFKGE